MSNIQPGFRQSNAWLHTWSGIMVGWLLYLIFLLGALSFFRTEINTWAQPELAQIETQTSSQAWQSAWAFLQQKAPNSPEWNIELPNERNPAVNVRWFDEGERPSRRGGHRAILDPATGEQLHPRETRLGDFLYRMHFELYGVPRHAARWFIGIATMAMFIGLITGIIIHKKIFKDFFTFRQNKGQRSWLDMHNVSSVLALPFHLMITFSGLLLLIFTLMPWGLQTAFNGDVGEYFEAMGGRGGKTISETLTLPTTIMDASSRIEQIDVLMGIAETKWPRGVDSLQINNSRRAMQISLRQQGANSLLNRARGETLLFDINKSELSLINSDPEIGFWRAFYNSFTALHLLHYADALSRWLFFLGGLLGTMMIGTGLLLWVEKRRQKAEKTGEWKRMFRLVQILNVGTIAGLPLAITFAFWANRLLPVELAQRELWEIRIFFITWFASLVYSFIRSNRQAWVEQLALLSGLLLLLPVFNLITLPRYSVLSMSFDAVLIVMGLLAASGCKSLVKHGKSSILPVSRKNSLMRSMS